MADAIVILGARVLPGGVASRPLRCRAELGARLFLEGRAKGVVISGGGSPVSEAEVAAGIVRGKGVPEEALVLETRAKTTRENAIYCATLLRRQGARSILLVTDPSHMFRARREFERMGIAEIEPAPAVDSEAGATGAQRAKLWTREAFAILRRPWLWF